LLRKWEGATEFAVSWIHHCWRSGGFLTPGYRRTLKFYIVFDVDLHEKTRAALFSTVTVSTVTIAESQAREFHQESPSTVIRFGMVNVDLYSAIITKVSNAPNTLVSGEKPGFQALIRNALWIFLPQFLDRSEVDWCEKQQLNQRWTWVGSIHGLGWVAFSSTCDGLG